MIRRISTAAISLSLLLGITVGIASAGEMVPMKGRFEGVGGQGFWGNCTHLGQFEGQAQGGLTYWYAANGDWIAWQVTAFIPGESNPPISNFQLVQTIVDGSGRFKGAKGTVTLDIFQNDLTKEFDGTIDGTISRPNSGKK